MKLSINQGPKVGNETFRFSISDKLTKELGAFLYNQDESGVDFIQVKLSFSLALYSSLSGSLDNVLENKEEILKDLKKRLCSFLHSERVTFEEPYNYFEKLLIELEKEI